MMAVEILCTLIVFSGGIAGLWVIISTFKEAAGD